MSAVPSILVARTKRPSQGRQEHPSGELISIDEIWKARVRREIKARKWLQKDLADKVGVVPATITNLLGEEQMQGRRVVVEAIHRAFGWEPPPATRVIDEAYAKIVNSLPSLSEIEREQIAALVNSLATKR